MTTSPVTFNPFDPAFRVDPYPVCRRLLEEAPVHRTAIGVTVISRYADHVAILRDHRRWSSDFRKSNAAPVQLAAMQAALGEDADILEWTPSFLFLDPPDHTRLRRLVNKAFTPRVVENLRPRIQKIVDGLLDAAMDKGEMEVVEEFAYPLPVIVICEMLGVPPEDHETFKEWSRVAARSLDPAITLSPEELRGRAFAQKAFRNYFRGLVEERRKAPRDDLLSALIAAEQEGDKLTLEELLSTCSLLLVAGHETTVNLIANGVLQFIRHPGEFAKLRADPSLAPSAVEEVLRFDPPVQMNGRLALEDTQFDGETVRKGEAVTLLIGASNRDPAQFPDPDRFDIERGDDRHVSFGYGSHFCLGAPLARLEGQIAFDTIARRFSEMELMTETLEYKPNIVLRGLDALPVRFRVG